MATKDFKVRHGLTVVGNATIEGNLTLGGDTVSRVLDSDNVINIVNNNTTGLTDSDLKVVADLRNDVDSDFTAFNTRINTLESATDNTGFDSDQVVTIISENAASNSIVVTSFIYTSPANDSDFSGADDNGRTLSYAPQKIDVFLNGILLTDTVDYIATDGSTVSLVNAPDSDDILTIKRYFGTENTSAAINVSVFTFTATGSLDSEFSGTDDNGSTLSYNVDKIHVYLNGVLLTNITDYTATNGTSITLSVAPDSDDVLTVVKYLGTVQASFDSDQIVAIINENVVSGSVDSDVAAVAALRRDADSDSTRIQAIATEIEALNVLVDSDLKAIADLRNDVDSDSIVIQKLRQDLDSESIQISALRADVDSDSTIINNLLHESDTVTTIYANVVGPTLFRAQNQSGETLFPGIVVYISGVSGNTPTVDKANASSSSTMPAFGIVSEESSNNSEVLITTFGTLKEINTEGFNVGDTIYVSADSDGAFTATKPTGETELIQNIGYVTRVHASSGSIKVGGSGRTNDIDNVTRARLDSDSTVIQNHSGRINVLESRADSDETQLQVLNTSINTLRNDLDSESGEISALRRDADSDSLVIQTLRGDVDTLQDVTHLDSESVARVTDTQFTIVNNGASAYSFTGDGFSSSSDNPTLYLQRGHTYHFNVNASGHPFEIRLSNGGSAYSTGVTNNAAQVGRVVFTVPMNAPETLVYQCTNHSGMVGTIRIGKQGFDSDQIASMILENAGSGGFDSDQIVTIIQENPGSQAINTTVYTFTSAANDSEFSGSDDNSQTLSYTTNKIYVYLNGILLTDTVDYTATNGTSVVLVNAPDSDDVLTIIKHVGTVQSGFDSDQVIAIINETAQGLTDSDLKTLADLRNDIDSESAVIRQLRREQDSDSANSGSSGGGGAAGFDSDQVVAIISENAASNSIVVTRFDFTATGSLSSTFSGTDDNGRTLQYAVGKIDVYLNGILLKDTDDYTATDGTSVVLQTAPDSDDVLSVKKYFGTENTSQTLNITRFDYTATQGQLAFTGSDNNSNTLQYETGKVQVFLNGILLLQTEDYLDSDGATITLTSAADSDDQLSIIKYLGTVQTGFDSDQVVAIISENATSVDSDYIIARQIVDAKHYNYSGTLATNTGSKRLYMHRDGVLGTFDMHVATAPVGAAINITVNKNGSSIGTGTITSGNTDNNLQTLSTTTFNSGDYLTVDITQIGTTTAGEDLYVVFRIVG